MKSITKALEKSEQATELVKESAEELASVNSVLKQQMKGRAGVTEALAKNAVVEEKVAQATDELVAVNHALEGEIRDRQLLDQQLAAITEQEEAARHAAFHDVLTGLPNRALDKFKSINDTHGHDVGDLVLTTVAQRLKDNTRGDDTVSRLGGDEFLYLLMEVCDRTTVSQIAGKIISALDAPLPVRLRNLDLSLRLKASIGISVYPKHGVTVDALIASADLAMYKAKRNASGYAFAT